MAEAESYIKPDRDERQWMLLIGRIAQSDQTALAELYDTTSRFVYGLALRIVADRAAAEEITLDVYTQVWKQAGSYDASRGTITSWLFMLARSRAIDFLRSKTKREQSREEPLDEAAGFTDSAPSPEESTALAFRRRLVLSALTEIANEQREVIELAYFSGLSHSEIAARLGQPLGTVKTRIRLGMVRLRELLRPYAEAI